MSCWGQAGANDCSSSPPMGDFPVPRPDSQVLCFPFHVGNVVSCRRRWAALCSSLCVLWQIQHGLVGKEAELCMCRAQRLPSHKPQYQRAGMYKCDGMGLALRIRRWNPSQSPRMLKLYFFIMGREHWVLCSLSPPLPGVSNREWD